MAMTNNSWHLNKSPCRATLTNVALVNKVMNALAS